MPDSIILKLKSLWDSHVLEEIQSLLSIEEIISIVEIYRIENKEDPDTIADAIDFIINNL